MADGAGVEPARPEGLDALAPRCLAARPTIRWAISNLQSAIEPMRFPDCLLPADCPNWSAWVDLNHRSPASKAGRDDQAPLHAGRAGSLRQERSRLYVPANRSVNPACKIGAHGRTRTCILPIRNRVLSPIELRVRDWCRDGDTELRSAG